MRQLRRTSTIVLALVAAILVFSAPAGAAQAKDCKPKRSQASLGGSVPLAAVPSMSICSDVALGVGTVTDGAKCVILKDCGSIIPGGGPTKILGDVATDVVGGVASGVGETVLDATATWIGKGTAWLAERIFKSIQKSTTPKVNAAWFKAQYQVMMYLAALVAVFTLLLAGLRGVRQGKAGAFVKAAFAELPVAFLITGGAIAVTQALLIATDALTAGLTSHFGTDIGSMVTDVIKFSGKAQGAAGAAGPAVPAAVALLMSLLAGLGALMVWFELIVREAALYIALLFLPIGMMADIHPGVGNLKGKVLGLLGLIIGSKFVICFVFAFGAYAMAHAGQGDGVTQVFAGAITMLLAAVAPMVILKIINLDAVGDAHGQVPGHQDVRASSPSPSSLVRASRSTFGGGGGSGAGPAGGGGGVGGGGGGTGAGGGGAGGGAGGAAAAAGPLAAAAMAGASGAKKLGDRAQTSAQETASAARTGGGGVVDAPGNAPASTGAPSQAIPRPAFASNSNSEPSRASAAPSAAASSNPGSQPAAATPLPKHNTKPPLPHLTRSPLGPGEVPNV